MMNNKNFKCRVEWEYVGEGQTCFKKNAACGCNKNTLVKNFKLFEYILDAGCLLIIYVNTTAQKHKAMVTHKNVKVCTSSADDFSSFLFRKSEKRYVWIFSTHWLR